jgi:hypothetical protein
MTSLSQLQLTSSSLLQKTTMDDALLPASDATERIFTCFPNLPLEIRQLIWEYCSNLPRNLDIWNEEVGDVSYHWRLDGHQEVNWQPFKFFTTQSLPGVFLASKESHAIAVKYYHMSFFTTFHRGTLQKHTNPPTILTNFSADRICPMGVFEMDPALEICYAGTPSSCAVNVYMSPGLQPQQDPLMPVVFCDDGFHQEILLYYCEELNPRPGDFEFIDITEATSPAAAWKVLNECRQKLNNVMDKWERFEEERLEIMNVKLKERPRIRFVAIIVNGVRRY